MRLCNNALFNTEKGVIEGNNSLILIEICLITMGWLGPTPIIHLIHEGTISYEIYSNIKSQTTLC